jgi:hypothetical protein
MEDTDLGFACCHPALQANMVVQDIRRIVRNDTRVINKLHRRVFLDKITQVSHTQTILLCPPCTLLSPNLCEQVSQCR